MKALSLCQPYAQAICVGLKKFETRSWPCAAAVMGEMIAIHAAKKRDREGLDLWTQTGQDEIPFTSYGAVVALVRIVKCWKTEVAREIPGFISIEEHKWGDFSAGRWCWQLKLIYVFEDPIPTKGMQGLFGWEIPDWWMEQAAVKAGMPTMFDLWKMFKENEKAEV